MAAITELQRTQVGKQVSQGTSVAATTIMRGKADTIKDPAKLTHVDEQTDIINGTTDSFFDPNPSMLPIPASKASPLLAGYIAAYGYQASTTGVTDTGTGATGKVYSAPIPVRTGITVANYATVEFGNDFEAEYIADALIHKWEWNAPYKTMSTLSYEWIGGRPDRIGGAAGSGLFTSLSTLQAVSYIHTTNCKMFIDAVSGTYGTTQATKLLSFKVMGEILYEPEYDAGGVQDAYGVIKPLFNYTKHLHKFEFTLRHQTTAGGATGGNKNLYRTGTPLRFRFYGPGKALATAGVFTNECIQVDLPGKITEYDKLTSQNGWDTVKFLGESWYDPTVGDAGKYTAVIDALAALP